jgi:hypothetical protein
MPRGPHQEGGIEIREVNSATPAKVKKKFQWTPYSPTCSCADTKAIRTSSIHTPTDLPHPNWHSLSPGSQHPSSQSAAQIPGAARGLFFVEHLHPSCSKVGHPTSQKVHFSGSLMSTLKTSVTSWKTEYPHAYTIERFFRQEIHTTMEGCVLDVTPVHLLSQKSRRQCPSVCPKVVSPSIH